MSTKKQLPPRDIAWIDLKTGRPTEIFFDWAKSIDERVFLDPVSKTAPADTEAMVYNSTSGVWEPGAN
jgi:hypothetical protein